MKASSGKASDARFSGGAFDQQYFEQLTFEVVQTRHKEGRSYRVWILPPGKRNEALDTFVYAVAARQAIPVRLDRLAPIMGAGTPRAVVAPPPEASFSLGPVEHKARIEEQARTAPVRKQRVIVCSSYMTRY